MDRLMSATDPGYMHRSWLIKVDYKDPDLIKSMQNPQEVYTRMESQGALLALSAALVRSDFSTEDEVRLIFDAAIQPALSGVAMVAEPELLRLPFSWDGFVDDQMDGP